MDFSADTLLLHFLRTFRDPFTAKEMCRFLHQVGIRASIKEVADYLESDPLVFPLEHKLYLTRAGAFTGQFFSFVPTPQEIAQQVIVPGDRCIPFVDMEMLSCTLQFEYSGKLLEPKVFETDCNMARELFSFFGDEYSAQYIAADPVNRQLNLAEKDFELPSLLSLTGVSIERIMQDCDFKYGDRLLCRVVNWDRGIIEVFPLVTHKHNPMQIDSEDMARQHWNDMLEKTLLESFDRLGPCASMDEQLANVFYENRKKLCTADCGSIHEFLESSKKVSMELFGVETRLWRTGQDVPAVGQWNRQDLVHGLDGGVPLFNLPDYVIDCFIQDLLYEKKDDVSGLVKRIIPKSMEISPEEEEFFTLQIMHRNAILRKKYNWFADFSRGSIRHRALELYSEVGSLVYDIDCASDKLEQMPQQELVTLSQLFTHVSRMLEALSCLNENLEGDEYAMQLSLEGMEYNFEDIRVPLVAAIERLQNDRFKII
ncbi:MAG: hypothetical protein II684_06515 [Treponema sp.]|nr:hypothetical protein [Treponema sp.]MBR4464274.1 hypothetical protein [Treponema sp.]